MPKYNGANSPTFHSHPQSLDSGCLPESFVKRELELGTGVLCSTDHGSLAVTRNLYKLAKKNGLIYVPGLEGYFRDDNDYVLQKSGIEKDEENSYYSHWKYGHLTLHALDQKSFEVMVKCLSKADDRSERHGSERKPLFDWDTVTELGAQNITMGSGCLIGMVTRHLLQYQNTELAEKYFVELMGRCKPGNFYAEVFPHRCDSKYDSAIYIVYDDGTEERFPIWKTVATDEGKSRLDELAKSYARKKREKPNRLVAVMENRKLLEREPKLIKNIEKREGILKNECTPYAPNGDVQQSANKFILEMAKKYNVPVVLSDDSHIAYPEQKIAQDIRLTTNGNWQFTTSYHRFDSQTMFDNFHETLGVPEAEFDKWVHNTIEWGQRFKDFKFKDERSLPTNFYPKDTLRYTMDMIEKHGRMDWSKPEYVERLKTEIKLFHKNGVIDLLPYFFPLEEANDYYEKEVKKVTGVGRGSAAGTLLSYYLNITHADPIKWGLSLDRFLTLDRIQQGKFPDIDSDYSDREPLLDQKTGWLKKRFGDYTAPVSVDVTLKLRSAVLDVARVQCSGQVPKEIAELAHNFINAPQGITDALHLRGYVGSDGEWIRGSIEEGHAGTDYKLLEYIQKYPDHWKIVEQLVGINRSKSRHACANLITGRPVSEFIPMTSVTDVKVTQYTAESCEAAGAIKYDFLGLNSLADIDRALKLVRERQGVKQEDIIIDGKKVPGVRVLPYEDKLYDVWDPPEIRAVFENLISGQVETVFQYDAGEARKCLKHFNFTKPDGTPGINSIREMANFTSLARPGPLDYQVKDENGKPAHNMLIEYVHRVKGEPSLGRLSILDELLPETHGVIIYQEQLTRVFKEVGNTTGIEAENFRMHVGKKMTLEIIKDKEIFMRGAVPKLGQDAAQELWDSLETFGRYGFNLSHAICYSITGYICAFLKYFYPLEWWTAVLRNASKDEIDSKFWRYCGHLILLPDVAKSNAEFSIEGDKIRAPLGLLNGVGPKAHEQLVAGRPYSSVLDICNYIQKYKVDNTKNGKKGTSALNIKVMERLIVSGALDSLFPSDFNVDQKLVEYNKALWVSEGSKGRGPKTINPKYINLTETQIYQYRKEVLPAYTCDLVDIFSRTKLGLTKNPRGNWSYNYRGEDLLVIKGKQLEKLESSGGFISGGITVGVPIYVVEDTRKVYHRNGRANEMSTLVFDIEGTRREFVRWPNRRTGRLPEEISKNQKGVVGLAILNRWAENKPFSVEDIIVIEDSLENQKEKDNEQDEENS